MVRTIAAAIYMVVWGVATVFLLVKGQPIPPEYWSLPALGLGALLTAIGAIEKKGNKDTKEGEAEDST